jgi:hypothetical protein
MELDFTSRMSGMKGDLALEGLKVDQHLTEVQALTAKAHALEEDRRKLEAGSARERDRAEEALREVAPPPGAPSLTHSRPHPPRRWPG